MNNIIIELDNTTYIKMQELSCNTVIDLQHLPFTNFTLKIKEFKNISDKQKEDVKEMIKETFKENYKNDIAFNSFTQDKKNYKKFIEKVTKEYLNKETIIDVNISENKIFKLDHKDCLIEGKLKYDFYDERLEDSWEVIELRGKNDELNCILQQEENDEFLNRFLSYIRVSLGVFAHLQNLKRENKTAKTRVVRNLKNNKKSKKNKVYITNTVYYIDSKDIEIQDANRNYTRKTNSWFTRGHWRHYKNGHKVWISSIVKKAKNKIEEDIQQTIYKLK